MEAKKTLPNAGLESRLAAISGFLADQKAVDPFVHIFHDSNPIADAIIVVSATSGRHARGLADGLLRLLPEQGQEFLHMEGYESAQWILVDCNDVVVHIFQPDTRSLYKLEDICRQPAVSKKEIFS